ncbi:MAG TPA: GDP-mannose 4,6-dehydratase [Candidatus Paceibacterota bacterium]|nr:GDP-mannose 4,6-dehydratase [Candidatus Paceibacterota bacterium]
MSSKTVLVIGGAGFIGSYIAKKLLKKGCKVIVYDAYIQYFSPLENRNYQAFAGERLRDMHGDIEFVRGDVRDKYFLKSVIEKYKPSHIILLAGLPIADIGDKNPEEAISSIIQGAVNVLDSIKGASFIERFVYTSSSMVYGDFEYAPADEEHPKRPKGMYGAARLSGEILTESYGRRYGIPYTIIRPSAVYGPGDVNKRVTQIFLENAFEGKPITLHNGGQSKLDFSFAEDVAEGFVLATFSPKALNQTFNITRGEGRSLKELADIIKRLSKKKVVIKSAPADVHRPERGALSIEKAKKLLGYKPKYSLEEGMKKYYEFVKRYYEPQKKGR